METIQIWIDETDSARPYIVSRGVSGEDAPATIAVCESHEMAVLVAKALAAETRLAIIDECEGE